MKKVFLKISQNSQENTCARVSFLLKLQAFCDLTRKEILAQVFSCEFCEICKNTYFYRTPLVAASVQMKLKIKFSDWQWSFTLYIIMFQIRLLTNLSKELHASKSFFMQDFFPFFDHKKQTVLVYDFGKNRNVNLRQIC